MFKSDAHYTPDPVLVALLAGFGPEGATFVFDPCVGDGALLRGVQSRVGEEVSFSGADINEVAIAGLRVASQDWLLGRANLYSRASRSASPVWRRASAQADLVVMNPPFSYRGKARVEATLWGIELTASPAAAALAVVLSEMQPSCRIFAILPRGTLSIDRDRRFWDLVRSRRDVDLIPVGSGIGFPGVSAKLVLVRVGPEGAPRSSIGGTPGVASRDGSSPRLPPACVCVEIIRGTVPRHRRDELETASGIRFVHTTDLPIASGARIVYLSKERSVRGPLVLIPRVGAFDERKIVRSLDPLVLSDCIVGLRTLSTRSLARLHREILESVDELRALYGGTCAPYITIARVAEYLAQLGWNPRIVKGRDSAQVSCDCGWNRLIRSA